MLCRPLLVGLSKQYSINIRKISDKANNNSIIQKRPYYLSCIQLNKIELSVCKFKMHFYFFFLSLHANDGARRISGGQV